MFISQSPAADSHPIFSNLDSIARDSGLISRRSHKFSARGFLLSLLQSVTRGSCSLNQIAMGLGAFELDTMSRQALHKRFSAHSSIFLLQVIGSLLARRAHPIIHPLKNTMFRRVLVEDSTIISMAKSNAQHFPNNGNRHDATAGCKVNLLTDLISGRVLSSELHEARSPDQALADDILDHCRKGDLIIRDMGFFAIDPIEDIERRGAFWISRLPASVALSDVNGTRLEVLLRNTPASQLDIEVRLGSKRQHPCRLVATRLGEEQTRKNRRHRRRGAKRRGAIPSKDGLLRDQWSLIITNLEPKALEASKLYELYSLRWAIEIQFRAFKQACHINHALRHKSDPFHIEALVLASMIFQLLTLDLHARFRPKTHQHRAPSLEKLSDAYAAYLLTLTQINAHTPFRPDPRHLYHDSRKRPTLWHSIIHCLG